MKPTFFWIGNVPITAYGLFIALSFTIGWMYCDWFFKKLKFDYWVIQIGYPLVFFIAILGSRFFYILTQWSTFIKDPGSFLSLRSSGMVFYGGLIIGVLAAFIYFSMRKINFLDMLDMVAVPTALGLGITRIGCFFNGCCYGIQTDSFLGVRFPLESFPVQSMLRQNLLQPGDPIPYLHPTQLYESVFCFVLAFYCWHLTKHRRARGVAFFAMTGIYSIARFLLEFLRGDLIRGVYWVFSTSQYISLVMIPLSFLAAYWLRKNRRLPESQYGLTPAPDKR